MQPPIRMMEPGEDPAHGAASSMGEPLPLLAIVNAVLRNRWRIAALVAVLCGGAIAYSFLSERQWISKASFSLQGSDSRKLSGLAAQFGFGLNLSSADAAQSPEYYVELLSSREILDDAVNSRYTYRHKGKVITGTLADIYEVKGTDPAIREDEAARLLMRAVSGTRQRETGIVKVEVSANSPVLAQAILTRLIDLLNEFNRKTRQSRASNERRFLEQRLAEETANLRGAENRYQIFLERNRGSISGIPELAFERDRLSREVSTRQQVYTSLVQNYEQARIDEIRDAPSMTLIETPGLPARPAPRGTIRRTFIALILGLLFGILPLVMRVMLTARRRSMDEERAEFRKLRGEIKLWRKRRDAVPPLTAKEA